MITITARHMSKKSRAEEASILLITAGISYSSYNNNTHYILDTSPEIHYYPTTGRWYIPSTGEKATESTRYIQGVFTKLNIPYTLV